MAEPGDPAAHHAGIRLLTEQAPAQSSGPVLLISKLKAVSRRMGFAELSRERMGLVCQEMASNQVKYAGGSGLVQIWELRTPRPALDLFAMDFGPGIANLPAALDDGYTTAGTMGKGLGAIRRLADASDFYTIAQGAGDNAPWHGLAVWARFYVARGPELDDFEIGRYLRAYGDGPYNGDCLGIEAHRGRLRWLHMDGLGHGAEAAAAVSDPCQAGPGEAALASRVAELSDHLAGTRGAVGLIGEVDAASHVLHMAGVGDMAGYVIARGERRNISFSPGVLGHAHRHCDEARAEFPPQALALTCSDGIRRSWTLGSFPSLWRLHPQMIALLLGQTLGRTNDDKSLFTIRRTPAKGA